MAKKSFYKCDRCGGSGTKPEYGHVDNGTCFKCGGVGLLKYDPTPYGKVEEDNFWSEENHIAIQQEQELIARAELETWKFYNNIDQEGEC